MRRCAAITTLPLLLAALLAGRPATGENAGKVRTESFRLINVGVTAYKQGDYAAAVEALAESARMALNSFRAHYYLGLALIGDRRYPDAVEALGVALDLDPSHLNAHVALGNAHLKIGDTDEARASFFRALKLRAEFPPALDGLGRTAEARARDEEAVEFYRRAIDSNRGYAEAYTHLGDLYLRSRRTEEAVKLMAEAVRIRPDFAPGLNRLARAYAELGLSNEAVAHIRRAIALEPKAAEHRAALGEIYLTLGEERNAGEAFAEALAIDPASPEARRGLAELARRRGAYGEALGHLDAALADERIGRQKTEELTEFRGRLLAERDRFLELVNLVLIGRAPPEGYRELARIYAGRRLWSRALALQLRAPGTDEDREVLAYLLFRSGRFREAQQIYGQLAASTRRPDLSVNNGVTLALLGDDAGALAAYDRALELDPSGRTAMLYRGNALLRLGRNDDAAQAYLAYLEKNEDPGAGGERIRRILEQIAPDALPEVDAMPDAPPPPRPAADEDEPS